MEGSVPWMCDVMPQQHVVKTTLCQTVFASLDVLDVVMRRFSMPALANNLCVWVYLAQVSKYGDVRDFLGLPE